MEHWVNIPNEPNYQVSNLGNVRNKNTGLILRQHPNKKENGYLRVALSGGRKYYVHRLVADSFFTGFDKTKMDVNHKDGNKYNNHIANLEFCTRKENIRHAFDNNLRFPRINNVVRCKFCLDRYQYDICDDKPDGFYCGYGRR